MLGFAPVFTSYGAAFGALGTVLIRQQDIIIRILGAFTIVPGLMFAGVLRAVPGLSRTLRPRYQPRVGLAGAPLLGVMFGIGWTLCIGPTHAAVLPPDNDLWAAGRGAVLPFASSIGLGVPFLLAAFGISRAFRPFTCARRDAWAVMRTGAAMLVALGILEVTGVWGAWLASLRARIGSWLFRCGRCVPCAIGAAAAAVSSHRRILAPCPVSPERSGPRPPRPEVHGSPRCG